MGWSWLQEGSFGNKMEGQSFRRSFSCQRNRSWEGKIFLLHFNLESCSLYFCNNWFLSRNDYEKPNSTLLIGFNKQINTRFQLLSKERSIMRSKLLVKRSPKLHILIWRENLCGSGTLFLEGSHLIFSSKIFFQMNAGQCKIHPSNSVRGYVRIPRYLTRNNQSLLVKFPFE